MTRMKRIAAAMAMALALQAGAAAITQTAQASSWFSGNIYNANMDKTNPNTIKKENAKLGIKEMTKEEKAAAKAHEKELQKQASAARRAKAKKESAEQKAKEKAQEEAETKRMNAPLGQRKIKEITDFNAKHAYQGVKTDPIKLMDGYWYNEDDYPKAVISNGYVNGYKYVGMENAVHTSPYDGSGRILLEDSKGNRHTMKATWHNDGSKHSYLVLDGTTMWQKGARRDKSYYFESVSKVNLGMTQLKAIEVMGKEPSRTFKIECLGSPEGYSNGLYYADRDITIGISPTTGLVEQILLGARGARKLDISTLDCTVQPRTFKSRYNMADEPRIRVAGHPASIGGGEYLDFTNYPDYISLSLYSR